MNNFRVLNNVDLANTIGGKRGGLTWRKFINRQKAYWRGVIDGFFN